MLLRNFLRLLLIVGSSFILFACGSGSEKQTITIAGSTTILPVSETWATSFRDKTGILVNVQGGGSTNGIHLSTEDLISLGASSRDLNDKEKEKLNIIPIGYDALAVIVNKDNPINNISSSNLSKIFSGEITNWKELGGNDHKIQFINRESGSGTRSCFEDLIMCNNTQNCIPMSLSAIVLNSNAEVRKSVELVESSIGYISYGFLDENVKALKLNNIEISLDNLDNGSYKLARTLLYLRNKENTNTTIDKYLKFIMEPDSQAVLLDEGFVPYISQLKTK